MAREGLKERKEQNPQRHKQKRFIKSRKKKKKKKRFIAIIYFFLCKDVIMRYV